MVLVVARWNTVWKTFGGGSRGLFPHPINRVPPQPPLFSLLRFLSLLPPSPLGIFSTLQLYEEEDASEARPQNRLRMTFAQPCVPVRWLLLRVDFDFQHIKIRTWLSNSFEKPVAQWHCFESDFGMVALLNWGAIHTRCQRDSLPWSPSNDSCIHKVIINDDSWREWTEMIT